jgi:hypothetical protein
MYARESVNEVFSFSSCRLSAPRTHSIRSPRASWLTPSFAAVIVAVALLNSTVESAAPATQLSMQV